jgi:branched-subunit amino acid transport protein AzlD
MNINTNQALLIILTVAIVTFALRVIPFLLFPAGRNTPTYIVFLGRVLPPAIISMLIVYCVKNVSLVRYPFGLPELIAGGAVLLLHRWRHNNLISIGCGTALYMLLVQVIFV